MLLNFHLTSSSKQMKNKGKSCLYTWSGTSQKHYQHSYQLLHSQVFNIYIHTHMHVCLYIYICMCTYIHIHTYILIYSQNPKHCFESLIRSDVDNALKESECLEFCVYLHIRQYLLSLPPHPWHNHCDWFPKRRKGNII